MRTSWTIVLTIGLLLLPAAAAMAEYGPQDAQAGDIPPVSQPLVREGDFAIELAPLYGLGTPFSETEAEDLLAQAGILPLSGWISDYPVTPEILSQLQESAARAAEDGKLWMSAEESQSVLFDLAWRMGLPVPAGTDSDGAEEAEPPGIAYDQPVINNYYTGYGPPIITYYPPPAYYSSLYMWVPSPVWWYGYWFPGFYICNTFSTTIVVHSRTVYVRNRFVDHVTKRVVHVVPVVQADRHGGRPVTRIRTEDGRTFANLREMREYRDRPGRTEVNTANAPPDHGENPGARKERRDEKKTYARSTERSRDEARAGQISGRTPAPRDAERQRTTGNGDRTYTPEARSGQSPAVRTGGNRTGTAATQPVRSRRAETVTNREQQKQFQGPNTGIGRSNLAPVRPRRTEAKSFQKKTEKVETRNAAPVQRGQLSSPGSPQNARNAVSVPRQAARERGDDEVKAGRGSRQSSRDKGRD